MLQQENIYRLYMYVLGQCLLTLFFINNMTLQDLQHINIQFNPVDLEIKIAGMTILNRQKTKIN